MTEVDLARYSNQIDPHLTIWRWEIPVYLFLGGLTAGVMILTALASMRRGERSRSMALLPFAVPVLLSLGMGALFLDLAHKLHVWRFYLAFRWTSPMSWGAWILLVVYPVAILFGLATLGEADAGRAAAVARPLGLDRWLGAAHAFAQRHLPALRWAHLASGAALGLYTGILLSTLGARAIWNSALLGPLFLVSGLSTGAALMMLFPVGADERRFLAGWDLAAMGVELGLILLFLVGLQTSGADGRAAAGLLLRGAYGAEFWSLVVIAGLVVPFLLDALEVRFHLRPTLVTPALVLLGGAALRWILVAAGQA